MILCYNNEKQVFEMKKLYQHIVFKILFVLFLIVALLLSFYDHNMRNELQIRNNLKSITQESNELLNTTIAEKLNIELQFLTSYATLLSDIEVMDAFVLERVEPLLQHDLFSRIAISDANGISYTSDHQQHDASERAYFIEAMKGKPYISNKITSVIDQSEIVVMSVPIFHEQRVIGVLRANLNIACLYDYFSISVLSGNVSSTIVQSDGTNISQQENQERNFFQLLEENENEARMVDRIRSDFQNHNSGSLSFHLLGKERFAYYSHIPNTDWFVVSILPYSLIDEQLSIDFQHTIILAMKIILILCVFGMYIFLLNKDAAHKLKAVNHQLDTIISNTPGSSYKHELQDITSLILFNFQKNTFLDYTKKELFHLIQHDLFALIHKEDYIAFMKALKRMRAGKIYTNTYRIYDKAQRMHWYYDQRQIIEEDGNMMCYVEVIDITELKVAQEKLRISEERYQLILQESKSIIFEWNIDSDTIFFSEQWVACYGYKEVIHEFLVLTQQTFDGKQNTYIPLIEQVFFSKEREVIDCILPKADGSETWVRIMAKPIVDEEGYVLRVIGSIRDISQEKQQNLRLQKQAQQDGLTNLYNRSTSEMMINQAMQKKSEQQHILFVLDVDNFKDINDSLGHSSGDEALRKIAQALSSCLRYKDIIGRIGGDEFVVFISVKHPWSSEQVNKKCAAFLEALARITLTKDANYAIHCSIGIAISPNDGTTYQSLFDRADHRLYEAKKQGKNTYIYK